MHLWVQKKRHCFRSGRHIIALLVNIFSASLHTMGYKFAHMKTQFLISSCMSLASLRWQLTTLATKLIQEMFNLKIFTVDQVYLLFFITILPKFRVQSLLFVWLLERCLRNFQNCINWFLCSVHVSVGSASAAHSSFLPDSSRAHFLEQRFVNQPNESAVVHRVNSDWLSQLADFNASSSTWLSLSDLYLVCTLR